MNRLSMSVLIAGLTIVTVLSFSGCISDEEGADTAQMTVASVAVAGSTTVMPLAEACAEEFNSIQDKIHVSITGGGSGVGIKNAAQGLADVAMASRQVKSEEKATYGDDFQEFLVAYDAIAIVVSQAVYDSGISELSQDDIRAIYDGQITNWNELGGPEEDIYVVAREVGSGTRDTFNDMVMGSEEAETLGVHTFHGSNAEVKTAISSSDKGIGYLGLNYAQSGNVGVIAYDGVKPSAETIREGRYPLARSLYMYTKGQPNENAQKFLDFVLSDEGQIVAQGVGFVPIN